MFSSFKWGRQEQPAQRLGDTGGVPLTRAGRGWGSLPDTLRPDRGVGAVLSYVDVTLASAHLKADALNASLVFESDGPWSAERPG